MVYWGPDLFQSDRDYDIIDHFNGILKVRALEEQHQAERLQQSRGKMTKAEVEKEIDYSIYHPLCRKPEVVKEFLESSDVVKNQMLWLMQRAKDFPNNFQPDYVTLKVCTALPGAYIGKSHDLRSLTNCYYMALILGASAMSLGCNLPDFDLKATMKTCLENVTGLFKEQKKQLEKALADEGGFVPGEMWDFASMGLNDSMKVAQFLDMIKKKPLPADKCGMCGHDHGGWQKDYDPETRKPKPSQVPKPKTPLMACARCKTQKYCSEYCQKTHWKVHKLVCKKAEGA